MDLGRSILLIGVFLSMNILLAGTAAAVPEVTGVKCSVDYSDTERSRTIGTPYERACVVEFRWVSPPLMHVASCKLAVGQEVCKLDSATLERVNSYFASLGTPYLVRLISDAMIGYTPFELKYGCVWDQYSHSAGISPSPPYKSTCLDSADTCYISQSHHYICSSLPERLTSDDELSECGDSYISCRTLNSTKRIKYGICTGIDVPIAKEMDFGTDLELCQSHLSACQAHNQSLDAYLEDCRNGR